MKCRTALLATALAALLAACGPQYETVYQHVAYLDENGEVQTKIIEVQRPIVRRPHEFKTLDNPVHSGSGEMTRRMIMGH